MFGAIDAGVLIRYGVSIGVYHQLHLDLDCPPWVFVKPEHLTDVPNCMSWITSTGTDGGVISSVGHPSFERTRDWLESQGYIKTQRRWHNGDRVIKPFYFNNVYKAVGEQFCCAPAMAYGHTELYNDGKPLPIPNHRDLDDEW